MEFGVGIHGERGRGQVAFAEADELVGALVSPLVEALGLGHEAKVLVIVNGLGGTYPLELNVVARAVGAALDSRGITAARWLVGPYVTSLDMSGVSVTLTQLDDELTTLWDAPVHTAALTW